MAKWYVVDMQQICIIDSGKDFVEAQAKADARVRKGNLPAKSLKVMTHPRVGAVVLDPNDSASWKPKRRNLDAPTKGSLWMLRAPTSTARRHRVYEVTNVYAGKVEYKDAVNGEIVTCPLSQWYALMTQARENPAKKKWGGSVQRWAEREDARSRRGKDYEHGWNAEFDWGLGRSHVVGPFATKEELLQALDEHRQKTWEPTLSKAPRPRSDFIIVPPKTRVPSSVARVPVVDVQALYDAVYEVGGEPFAYDEQSKTLEFEMDNDTNLFAQATSNGWLIGRRYGEKVDVIGEGSDFRETLSLLFPRENPGELMIVNPSLDSKRAEDTFRMWHQKDPKNAKVVRPRVNDSDLMVCVGNAYDIVYASSKWEKGNKTNDYIHTFDSKPKVWMLASCVPDDEVRSNSAKTVGELLKNARNKDGQFACADLARPESFSIDNEETKLKIHSGARLLGTIDKKTIIILDPVLKLIVIRGGEMHFDERGIVK